MIPTHKLRYVIRKVPGFGSVGVTEQILQQWWQSDIETNIHRANMQLTPLEGYWVDVQTEEEK